MQTKTIGFLIIIIGILMIAYTGFNYVTTSKVVDLGSIKIEQEQNHPVQWSPYVGVALLIGGIIMVTLNKKKGV